MKKGEGFLIIELAIALGVISIFFALLAGFLANIAARQSEAIAQIKAVNYASSCLERQSYSSADGYEVAVDEVGTAEGRWSPALSNDELQELQKSFEVRKLSVTWHAPRSKKRSYSLLFGSYEKGGSGG